MRRKDREITILDEIKKIVSKNNVLNLSLNDNPYPYIIPLTYGYSFINDKLTLYFHGANEGYKHDLIKKDNHASFCIYNTNNEFINLGNDACSYTMEFESVIGQGVITYLNDDEKKMALLNLINNGKLEHPLLNLDENVVKITSVFKLEVSNYTAKRRIINK